VTPIIAFDRGSVPEVIEEGVSGFVVDTVDEAVRAVGQINTLSRLEAPMDAMNKETSARPILHSYG
jgi:glycosyltransferase involved in cell wall biosynthesis